MRLRRGHDIVTVSVVDRRLIDGLVQQHGQHLVRAGDGRQHRGDGAGVRRHFVHNGGRHDKRLTSLNARPRPSKQGQALLMGVGAVAGRTRRGVWLAISGGRAPVGCLRMGSVPSPMPGPRTDLGPTTADLAGLSSTEAEARRRRGEGNEAGSASSRSYARIVRTNVLNPYNTILFVIGAALLALGRYSDALISVSIGLLNAVISAVQEIRAKRQLDQLQLLARSGVVVVRDGQDTEVFPEAVVRGDVVRVRPGDQLVVDGPVLQGAIEVDESLLTGESDAQLRSPGGNLLSGSHCVGGAGLQLARDVGAASYANRLTAQARRISTDTTPLQQQIGFCVRLVMVIVILMSGAILLQAALEGLSVLRVVQTTAVLSGLVPYGLFFLIVVAYTVARRGLFAAGGTGAAGQRRGVGE